jgi:hypothetical protein
MEKNFLKGLDWHPLWASHVGCIKGCVDFLDLGHSLAWVYGATGHAFILNVSKDLCPSGPTTWEPERFYELGKNLGYEIKTVHGDRTQKDFADTQKHAWELVKLAINAGFPCYGWELLFPEYYVIYGYDKNRYFFKGPGVDQSTRPQLWMELGDTEIGVVDMHAVRPVEPADDRTTVKQALEFALEFPQKWVFERAKAGPEGYNNWIEALSADEPHSLGAAYNAEVWHECRHYAVEFLKEAKERLSGDIASRLDKAIEHYGIIREALKTVTEQFPFEGRDPEHVKDTTRKTKAMEALKVASSAEEEGLKTLEEIVTRL